MFNEWELLYSTANSLWTKLGVHESVYRRRVYFWKRYNAKPTPCPDIDYKSSKELEYVVEWAARSWNKLYDIWSSSSIPYVFPNGFALLFFIRILWANDVVLLRGHYDSKRIPISSLMQIQNNPSYSRDEQIEKAQLFFKELFSQAFFKNAYPTGVPKTHIKAILQHYGFPTDLIDFTYSYDVALYFAEGGTDCWHVPGTPAECGAIFAIPTFILPSYSTMITLPPEIMRPNLQRGVFVGNLKIDDMLRFEEHKFIFKHLDRPVWNGISNISCNTPIGLGKYLFPTNDPIEAIARKYR